MLDNLSNLLGYCGGWESAGDPYLPYLDHCRPTVMLLRDGSYLGMARSPGGPFTVAGNGPRDGTLMRHTAWLNAIADDNVEVFEHLVRHDTVPPQAPRPAAATAFDAAFLRDYNADIAPRMRANEWYISILVRPRTNAFARIAETARKLLPFQSAEVRLENAEAAQDDLLAQLEDAFALGFGLLRHLKPVRLGIRSEGRVSFSEIAEALELIRTTKFHKQPLVDPAGTLGSGLAAHDPIGGRRGFEVRYGPGGYDSHFGAILGITAMPREVCQDQFDDLLKLDGRFCLMNHVRFMNRAQQQDHLQHLRRLMTSGDDPDTHGEKQLAEAVAEVANGMSVRGICRWSLALHADGDPDPDRDKIARNAQRKIDKLVADARTIMVNAGVRVAPEGRGIKPALLAQLPGSLKRTQIRPGSLPTDFFASLSSLGGFAQGPQEYRWGGPTLRYLTTGGTAFDDDLFVGGVGHAVMVAPNGEGKTVVMGAHVTAARALVRAGTRRGTQIILDVDNSNEQTVLANGGVYASIKGGGTESGVAPLLLPNTPRVRAMLRNFVSSLCRSGDAPAPSPEEVVGVREGVDFVMGEMEPHERHLGVIRSFMGFAPDGAGARLERWCRQFNGDLAWAFDGLEHRIDLDVELVGIDMTGVMDDTMVMPPMGQLLLWLASEMMDGRRCIVWCEESPAYFAKPEFSRGGKAIALRARKRNACFIPIAQMPEDLLSNDAGKAIVKQARKFILLRNEGAERGDYCDGLGVSEPIFRMVKEGMFKLPYHAIAIVRRDGQSSVNQFDLSGLGKYLAVFSATTNSVKLFRSIAEKNGVGNTLANVEEFWRRLPEAAA